jgi:hypothetical protein
MRTLFITLLLLASLIGGTLAAKLSAPAGGVSANQDDEYDPCNDPTVTCSRIRIPVG